MVLLQLKPGVATLASKWNHPRSSKNYWFLGCSPERFWFYQCGSVLCDLSLERFKNSSGDIKCSQDSKQLGGVGDLTCRRMGNDRIETQENILILRYDIII